MREAAGESIYSVDSSSLMDWQARYYPSDVFRSLPEKVDRLIASGRFVAPSLLRDEINAVGTAELHDWAGARSGILVPAGDLLAEALAIQNRFAGLRDPKAEHEEADAYVIALARIRNGIVITQETAASEKHRPRRAHFIPDVCREIGVPCVSFLGLMRREGWIL